ncbi:lipopolysaccharide assembly protein LapA domain-containing protein [Geopsychrobacter electrodiphilus]|uniref:lipopolysaccharide assembly protein LapA domain-containing protein n=1 Tax=Geopsychrobacter electrodiphilus TaxID=225196 RepID=UPI0003774B96|nr:LapA family protein [Geopsychrobacter electrodiphilus]
MRWKLYLSLILLTLVLIFVMQNTETVVFNFLFWNFGLPRALLLLVVFVAGITTGLLLVASKRPSRSKNSQKKTAE